MTPDSYIKAIVHHIEGSSKTKKEKKARIEEEIACAMESKSLMEVVAELGAPKDVAVKYNEELPVEERLHYKRVKGIKRFGAVVIVLIGVILCCNLFLPRYQKIDKDGRFDPLDVELQVQNVISMIDSQEYDALQDISTDGLEEVLTAENMASIKMEKVGTTKWGECESMDKIYMSQCKQYGEITAIARVKVVYENVTVTYSFTFAQNMKLKKLGIQ